MNRQPELRSAGGAEPSAYSRDSSMHSEPSPKREDSSGPSRQVSEGFTIEELPDDVGYDGDIEIQRPSGYEEDTEDDENTSVCVTPAGGRSGRSDETLEQRLKRLSVRNRTARPISARPKSGTRRRKTHKRGFSESFESDSDSVDSRNEGSVRSKRRLIMMSPASTGDSVQAPVSSPPIASTEPDSPLHGRGPTPWPDLDDAMELDPNPNLIKEAG